MAHARDNFLAWVRNAHAMEEQAITMLTAQVRRIENYPELKERFEQHLRETQAHAQELADLLERMSGGKSTLKDLAARLAATAQGFGGIFTNDEIIKAAIASYAFDHVQIGTYRVLIAAADEVDEFEAKAIFERMLAEETAMAQWLEANLDAITRVFLMRDERDLQAKR